MKKKNKMLRTAIGEVEKGMAEERETVWFGLQWSVHTASETVDTQEHWMVTLQKIYYPILAAIGIPCEYLLSRTNRFMVHSHKWVITLEGTWQYREFVDDDFSTENLMMMMMMMKLFGLISSS